MSDDRHEFPFGAAGPLAPWMRLWFDMASSAMENCQGWAGPTASPDALRKARSDILNAWSDWWGQQLRSPAFLAAAKQALSGNAEYQKWVREFMDQVNRELRIAGRPDIDQLTVVVRRTEERILDQLEDVSERLESIEARLDELAARLTGSPNGESEEEGLSSNEHEKRKPKRNQSRQTS